MKALICTVALILVATFSGPTPATLARDLAEIREEGVLRHLGIPYANFISGDGTGLDMELMELFAREIGVRYEYVQTSWGEVFGDLLGYEVKVAGGQAELGPAREMRGDVIANGLTVIPWRQQLIDFSTPTFPTQVWLVTTAESELRPITPSGTLAEDISRTRALMTGKTVLGLAGTCLDLELYNLEEVQAIGRDFSGTLNDMAPAVLNGEVDTTLLDVPDALVAMAKWPGKVKILGPVSEEQEMAVGFRKDSPELQAAFARFYAKLKAEGRYRKMVEQYYPDVPQYYPDFFTKIGSTPQ
jgi:ABC-type amino acid transport substrate-binding protein